jgi:MerR family transcriptional regulator, light-induced transcriptional regulator
MYTIKQAAARSGLTVPTVRVWERRYGVVHPARTATGYRLYDDESISRLIAMRHLVEGRGMRPGQAAEHLLAPGTDIDALVDEAAASVARGTGPTAAVPGSGGVADFVEAARILDVHTMERVLDGWFATERFESAVEHMVFAALRVIGDGWTDGRIDVAMEHAASETIRRRLAHFFDAAASGGGGSPILVGLPPGGHHEMGALAFAVAARRGGIDAVYLGANVPLGSWITAVESARAPVVVVGAVSDSDVAAAAEVVAALQRMPRPPIVAVGGRRAPDAVDTTEGVALPERLDDAVAAVRGMLARPS